MGGRLKISGPAGIVLLGFGLVAHLFSGNFFDPYVLAHFGVGASCLLVYLAIHGRSLLRSLGRRTTRRGLVAALSSIVVIGALAAVNYLGFRYHRTWDLTEAKIHSLAPESIKVIEGLEREVEVLGFFERGEHASIASLLRRYTDHSSRIRFRAIDPNLEPELARQLHIQQLNTLHIRYGEASLNLTEASEETITNALAKLSRGGKKTIYFVAGHGEPATADRQTNQGYGAARAALERENFIVRDLILSAQGRVPADAALVILAGPQKPLLERELEALGEHIGSGGRLMILLPSRDGESLRGFLRDWGIAVGDDLVLDQVIRLFAGPSLGVQPIVETYSATHPITRDFKERTIFPMVRSVEPAESGRAGITVVPLARTSPTSWAERDVAGIFQQGKAALGPEDKKGPVSIGVAVSANLNAPRGQTAGKVKMVVLGTAAFANNRFLNLLFNRDFFVNSVNWLADDDAFIPIGSRALRPSRVELTERQSRVAFYLSLLLFPEIILLIGLTVWWKRR